MAKKLGARTTYADTAVRHRGKAICQASRLRSGGFNNVRPRLPDGSKLRVLMRFAQLMSKLPFLLCALVLQGACATPQQEHPIVGMAAFDFNCPKEQLRYTQISRESWGVSGCGQRARYVQICEGRGFARRCQWVAN